MDINLRYAHIKSFGDLKKQFPGATPSTTSTAADDDDDVDLLGSDEEEVRKIFHSRKFFVSNCSNK